MKRRLLAVPGYDCDRGPCPAKGCPGFGNPRRPGGGHGIHGEEWIYSIIADDGKTALSLTVYTSRYPDTVSTSSDVRKRPPRGADLSLHSSVISDPESIARGAKLDGKCDLLEGGACYSPYTTGIGADQLFSTYGIDDFNQPEDFWLALEQKFIEVDAKERATWPAPGVTYELCSCCEGKGWLRSMPMRLKP